METNSIERLRFLCNIIPDLLHQLDEAAFSEKEQSDKWSKKEILGHLVRLVENMPNENLNRTCSVAGNLLTLQFLIDDYVVHLEHHLKQIISY